MDVAIIEGSAEARYDYSGQPIFLLTITNIKDVSRKPSYAQESKATLRR